jgi:hypothetical protein
MTNREPVDAVPIGIFPLENYEPTKHTLLGRHLYKTVAALEANHATPDETTIAYQAPFGCYNEGGTLAVDLTADATGLTTGQLAFVDPDKHHSFALTLADNRQYWYSRADSSQMPITHNHVARLLDRSRPLGDSELFRWYAINRGTTAADLQTLLDEAVLPTANPEQVRRDATYCYNDIILKGEQWSGVRLALTIRRLGQLAMGTTANLKIPYSCDELDAPVTCRITSDDLEYTTLACFYDHNETTSQRRRTYVEPDVAGLSNTIAQLTEDMITERCALQ